MNKMFSIIALTICTAAATGIISSASSGIQSSSEDAYYQYGQVIGSQSDPNGSDIVVEAETFALTDTAIDNLAKEYMVTGYDDYSKAYSAAIDTLVAKYAVYDYAVAQGYLVSDEYIDELIAEQKESFKLAENYSDFEAFLSGLQMTEDEYWESERENLTIYETIGSFKSSYFEEEKSKLSEAEYLTSDNAAPSEDELTAAVNSSYDNFVAELISNENVVIAG